MQIKIGEMTDQSQTYSKEKKLKSTAGQLPEANVGGKWQREGVRILRTQAGHVA